ncbi:substrate-binding periplasmic protein [Pseudoalteromonas lipolytica]
MRNLLILSLLLLIFPCFAAITVVTENLPNFHYQNEKGELVGTVVDKVKAALTRSGVNYTLSVNPWSVSYNAALRDSNTCIFSMARLPVREAHFKWISKLSNFTVSFYSFKPEHINIVNLGDAKRYRIAVLKDNYSHIYLAEHGFNEKNQLILLNSFDNIYDILKSRHNSIDLVVLSDEQFNFALQQDPSLSSLKPVYEIPVGSQELYFACNKNINNSTLEKLTNAFAFDDKK